MDLRLSPLARGRSRLEPEALREVVSTARERALIDHSGCELDWTEEYLARGFRLDPDHPELQPLWQAFRDISDNADHGALPEVSTFRSHSDASRLFHQGCLPVVCGPGELEVAHTPHEHVELEQLENAARLYAAMFVRCCA